MSDTVYVIQRGTNRIYPATDKLLERDDMMLIDKKTIDVRIEATKRLLEEKKTLLLVKQGAGVPQEIEDGATALNKLQAELAETNRAIAEMDKEKDKAAHPDQEPEDLKDANEKAFNDLVNNDNEIKAIKGMRKAKSVADYLAANYGIKKEYDQADTETLKEEAIQMRTGTLSEQFNK